MFSRGLFISSAESGPELVFGASDCEKVFETFSRPEHGGHVEAYSMPPMIECDSEIDYIAALSKFSKISKEADQRIFYYSGHGEIRDGQFGFVLGKDRNGFVPFDVVTGILGPQNVNNTIFIIDACHSGAAELSGRKSGPAEVFDIKNTGACVFSSSRSIEHSLESPLYGSVFTHFLCESIKTGLGGRKTTKGVITVEQALDYINDSIADLEDVPILQRPNYKVHTVQKRLVLALNCNGDADGSDQAGNEWTDEALIQFNGDSMSYPCLGASAADIDKGALSKVSQGSSITTDEDVYDALRNLGLLEESKGTYITKAAILCFSDAPHKFYPNVRSSLVIGEKHAEETHSIEIRGNLLSQMTQLVQAIMGRIVVRSEFAENGQRKDIPAIPRRVVRELVSNAIAHQNFDGGGRVIAWLTEDFLEISNAFPSISKVNISDLLDKPGTSIAPNPRIALHLQDLGELEGRGRGMWVLSQHRSENGPESINVTIENDGTFRARVLLDNLTSFGSPVDDNDIDAAVERHVSDTRITNTVLEVDNTTDVMNLTAQSTLLDPDQKRIDFNELLSAIGNERVSISIEGPPGVGKTVLAKKLFAASLDYDNKEVGDGTKRLVGVFLRGHEIQTSDALESQLAERLGIGVETLKFVLKTRDTLIVVDGIDEIPNSLSRKFIRKLSTFAVQYQRVRYIVTTRPRSQLQELADLFITRRFELRGFSRSEVEKLIFPSHIFPNPPQLSDSIPAGLIDLVLRAPVLAPVVGQMAYNRAALPETEFEIYQSLVDTMLFRHDASKTGYSSFSRLTAYQVKYVLSAMALIMLTNGLDELDSPNVSRAVTDAINNLDGPMTATFAEVHSDLTASGLIAESRVGRVAFIHRGIQEYLAASAARSLASNVEQYIQFLDRIAKRHSNFELCAKFLVHLKESSTANADWFQKIRGKFADSSYAKFAKHREFLELATKLRTESNSQTDSMFRLFPIQFSNEDESNT